MGRGTHARTATADPADAPAVAPRPVLERAGARVAAVRADAAYGAARRDAAPRARCSAPVRRAGRSAGARLRLRGQKLILPIIPAMFVVSSLMVGAIVDEAR